MKAHQEARRYGPPTMPRQLGICAVDRCGRDAIARGWCHTHYEYWRRHGVEGSLRPTFAERVLSRIDASGDCWEWLGKVERNGYAPMAVSHEAQAPGHRAA